MRWFSFLLTAVLSLCVSPPLHAAIIHVPADSTTIQGGIHGASPGDTVMVAPGTYHEHDVDFVGKAITVMSTDPEDSAVVAATVVQGDRQASIFIFQSGEDSTSVLAGLTITGGSARKGGGIFCSDSSPKIIHDVITDNYAFGGWDEGGGGMYNYNSSPTVTRCMFSDNRASTHGGGGMINYYSDPTVANCVFRGNESWAGGGGMANQVSSNPTVTNCVFSKNSSSLLGGGMYNRSISSPTVTNCTFFRNTAGSSGGGLYNRTSSNPTVTNCILWNDEGGEIYNDGSSNPIVTYSDVQGGYGGEGNMAADPQFVSFHGFDYLLRRTSPCIDAGDPAVEDGLDWPPRYPNGPRSDMGAYGGPGNVGWLQ